MIFHIVAAINEVLLIMHLGKGQIKKPLLPLFLLTNTGAEGWASWDVFK